MDKITHCINHNRFIPVDTEELTALELIGKTVEKTNEVVDKSNEQEERLNKKVSYDDMKNKYKHNDSDFVGSWHGIESPEYAEPGIANVVAKHSEQLLNNPNTIDIAKLNSEWWNKIAVNMGSGNYLLNDNISECNSTSLIGNNTIISGNFGITWNNKDSITIEGITFKDMKGLWFYTCKNVKIRNCKFINVSRNCIYAIDGEKVDIENCYFENAGVGVGNDEVAYLGACISTNRVNTVKFTKNTIERAYGHGAVYVNNGKMVVVDDNICNDTIYRFFSSPNASGCKGSISRNTITNVGMNRQEGDGVGSNAIFTVSMTQITVDGNVIDTVVENGIEGIYEVVSNNVIKNTGMRQNTNPTPSTEGIYANAKRIINNTIINTGKDGITDAGGVNFEQVIKGNYICRGENAITTSDKGYGISFYRGFNAPLTLCDNVIDGYDNGIFFAVETISQPVTNKNNECTKIGGMTYKAITTNSNYPGGTVLNKPWLKKDTYVANGFILNNVATPVDVTDGMEVSSTNQYDAYVYVDVETPYEKGVLTVQGKGKAKGQISAIIIPFINGSFDSAYTSTVKATSNGNLVDVSCSRLCGLGSKYRVGIKNETYATGEKLTIKNIEVSVIKNM